MFLVMLPGVAVAAGADGRRMAPSIEDVLNATLCYAILGQDDVARMADAIRNNYWYQMYIGAASGGRGAQAVFGIHN
jgi:hypothetical protein